MIRTHRLLYNTIAISFVITVSILIFNVQVVNSVIMNCANLRVGQYMCPDPNYNHIDAKTQQPIGCTKNNRAKVWCIAATGINCTETNNSSFTSDIPCKWT